MNRAHAMKLIAGLGALAGCAPNGHALTGLSKSTSGKGRGTLNVRTGVAFPQLRRDGSKPPTSSRGYKPKHTLRGVQRHISSVPNCTTDTCGGDGGGGGPSSPDTAAYQGDYAFYGWNADNYSETWDNTNDVLLQQHYFSSDSAGDLEYSVYMNDGTSAWTTLPGIPPNSGAVYSTSDGSAWGSWDEGTLSFSSQNSAGSSIYGTMDANGYVTWTWSDPTFGTLQIIDQWLDNGLPCWAMRLQADLAIANLLLMLANLGTKWCPAGPACLVINFLAQSEVWEQIAEIRNEFFRYCPKG